VKFFIEFIQLLHCFCFTTCRIIRVEFESL
jgi:hypothetical protein